MITTLDDFEREFRKIVDMGWIKTHRSGPTGIGKTLEDLLGIAENNLDAPDFGEYELKSSRLHSNSLLTLFTRAPQPAKASTVLRLQYGYPSGAYDNDEKVLHTTLSADRFTSVANTGHQLKVTCIDDRIYIESELGINNIYWSRASLQKCFEKKFKNKLVYVKADSRGTGSNEEFCFLHAYEMSGFNYESLIHLLENGKVLVDLRIGQYHDGVKAGKTHDHGTGFRIRESAQPLLFTSVREIV